MTPADDYSDSTTVVGFDLSIATTAGTAPSEGNIGSTASNITVAVSYHSLNCKSTITTAASTILSSS